MAHIASCLVANFESGHISKPASPQPPFNEMRSYSPAEKPFAWRMQQPEPQQRKYQLFPKDKQLPVLNSSKALDPEKAFALAMSQSNEKNDKVSSVAGLRIRINQHNLIRRRKVSVPELGPMTTVQEVPMDSPTIPGRPPLHERSISAPGNTRYPKLTDTFLYTSDDDDDDFCTVIEEALEATRAPSPRRLAPLVIPETISPPPQLRRQQSLTTISPGSDGPRLGRADESPRYRHGLITPSPSLSDLNTPRSANTALASASASASVTTPVSAPIMESHRSSPRPWERCNTPVAGECGVSDAKGNLMPKGHRRGQSESSSMSIMDRGRPRKRNEVRNNNGPLLKRSESKRSKSNERRAFQQLPKGFKPSEIAGNMEASEIARLQRQAFGQAERFEVLKADDVEALSKELRHLDERTEYLRRTHNSLRAGRRNLHSRICQYLRSPRVARFSHDSMLRQEEALAELDASIDDWVSKLEQAENRRTRVRQKLLEHVAAAAILQAGANAASESLQQIVGLNGSAGVGNITTPPRSPTKQAFSGNHSASSSSSPQRVVAQVPSTILEQPLVEEAATLDEHKQRERVMSAMSLCRSDVESIRIYAGDDVYALLADVENEITRMSDPTREQVISPMYDLPTPKHLEAHRKMSHELLHGRSDSVPTITVKYDGSRGESSPSSSPAPTPPLKDAVINEPLILTSAVFRP